MSSLPAARSTVPGTAAGPYRICFVCTGNICRSPMAAVVLTRMAAAVDIGPDRLAVTSVGTGPWHEGEPMDERARQALGNRGYDDPGHRARQVVVGELPAVDAIVALDRRHERTLRSLAGDPEIAARLVLLRAFDPEAGGAVDVPDPYYGTDEAFDRCLALVEAGCRGLLAALLALPDLPPRAQPGPTA